MAVIPGSEERQTYCCSESLKFAAIPLARAATGVLVLRVLPVGSHPHGPVGARRSVAHSTSPIRQPSPWPRERAADCCTKCSQPAAVPVARGARNVFVAQCRYSRQPSSWPRERQAHCCPESFQPATIRMARGALLLGVSPAGSRPHGLGSAMHIVAQSLSSRQPSP